MIVSAPQPVKAARDRPARSDTTAPSDAAEAADSDDEGGDTPTVTTSTPSAGPAPTPAACAVCGSQDQPKACAKCKKVAYCCREHQKQDWPNHKALCS